MLVCSLMGDKKEWHYLIFKVTRSNMLYFFIYSQNKYYIIKYFYLFFIYGTAQIKYKYIY